MRSLLHWCLCLSTILDVTTSVAQESGLKRRVVVIVGAPGESVYEERFSQAASLWAEYGQRTGADLTVIGPSPADDSKPVRADIEQTLKTLGEQSADDSVCIVLIGHGTFDGETARFNLEGPDVSASEFAEWLAPITAPTAVINCTSASGPFVNALSAPNRAIVTATKSGSEVNATRFGLAIAQTAAEGRYDLDKDGQLSILELTVQADRRVAASFADDGQIATEHALIDDNADGKGTPLAWFDGVRINPSKSKDGSVDGRFAQSFSLESVSSAPQLTAEQIIERDRLEAQLEQLRSNRPEPRTAAYFDSLEELLVQLGNLYQATPASTETESTE